MATISSSIVLRASPKEDFTWLDEKAFYSTGR